MPIIKQIHTPEGPIDKELTAEEAVLWNAIPTCEHLGRIVSFDQQAVRPLNVVIIYEELNIPLSCFVTQDLVDQYLLGSLTIGDFVIINFLEAKWSRAIARQKVFKTW